MKKIFTVVSLALVFSLILGVTASAESGYAYKEEDLAVFAPEWDAIQADDTVISVSVGAVQGEIRFAWLSQGNDTDVSFKISVNPDMSDSKDIAVSSENCGDYNSNKVTVTGLEEGRTYYYSYTENGVFSNPEPITIQNDENFAVLFVSDAQIGRSGEETEREVLIRDTCGWNYTVNKMLAEYPEAAFAISAGDQFQSPDSITQMKAYLSPRKLRSLPVANTIGNHDDDATLYGDIFNNPNEVSELMASDAGTGYYYTYGDALFITVNSNNSFMFDTAKVIRTAVNAYPDAKWRVLTMHHNPYSAAFSDNEFYEERLYFSTLIDCYDIDLVLSGHDHFYSRSEKMYGGKKADEGTVYIQSSSASGSNYDPLPETLPSCTVNAFDVRVPTYTALTFTENSLTGKTYRTDTDEIIDSFEIADNPSDSDASIFGIAASFIRTLFSML